MAKKSVCFAAQITPKRRVKETVSSGISVLIARSNFNRKDGLSD
jgi:hypothetical protein